MTEQEKAYKAFWCQFENAKEMEGYSISHSDSWIVIYYGGVIVAEITKRRIPFIERYGVFKLRKRKSATKYIDGIIRSQGYAYWFEFVEGTPQYKETVERLAQYAAEKEKQRQEEREKKH